MNTELMKYVESFDNGEKVRTVIMGGIVEGYEVAIQELAIEIMRTLMLTPVPGDDKFSATVSMAETSASMNLDKKHGFSGAQVGAAKNLAAIFWRKTPSVALAEMESIDNDRIILMWKDGNSISFNKKIGDE